MFRFVLDLVKFTFDMGRAAVKVAVLPITIPLRMVLGSRGYRRAKTAALLVGVGAAAAGLVAASADRRTGG